MDYLRTHFAGRVELIEADSRDALPALIGRRPHSFDLIHIDGSHEFAIAYADMANALELARADALILFDDTDLPELEALCDFFTVSGWVGRVELGRIWQHGRQLLLRARHRR